MRKPNKLEEYHRGKLIKIVGLKETDNVTLFKYAFDNNSLFSKNYNNIQIGFNSTTSTTVILTSTDLNFKVRDKIELDDGSKGSISNVESLVENSINSLRNNKTIKIWRITLS